MRNDYHLAKELREKGLSYNKISKDLAIPKSTICYWFKNQDWSKDITKELNEKSLRITRKRLRLINKRHKEKWEKWREKYRQEAREEYKKLKDSPLFISGIMLYWGEGDSKLENSLVRIANSDPEMIRMFCSFLKKIARIPDNKIRLSLVLYPDLDDIECKRFWMKRSKIKDVIFHKTQYIKGKHPTKRLSYGICTVLVCSRALKEKIFIWLKMLKEDI